MTKKKTNRDTNETRKRPTIAVTLPREMVDTIKRMARDEERSLSRVMERLLRGAIDKLVEDMRADFREKITSELIKFGSLAEEGAEKLTVNTRRIYPVEIDYDCADDVHTPMSAPSKYPPR